VGCVRRACFLDVVVHLDKASLVELLGLGALVLHIVN